MAPPPIEIRGLAEALSTSDLERDPIRIGLAAEDVQAQLHGRYYESALRGLAFVVTQTSGVQIVTQGSTSTSFAFVNPAGSGRLVVPIRWDSVITTVPASTVNVGLYGLYANSNVNAAVVTGTAVAAAPALLGTNGQAAAEAFASATLPVAPTLYRVLETKGADSKKVTFGTQVPFAAQFFYNFDGSCVLYPGTAISLQQLNADTSNGSAICSVVWEEVPYVPDAELMEVG